MFSSDSFEFYATLIYHSTQISNAYFHFRLLACILYEAEHSSLKRALCAIFIHQTEDPDSTGAFANVAEIRRYAKKKRVKETLRKLDRRNVHVGNSKEEKAIKPFHYHWDLLVEQYFTSRCSTFFFSLFSKLGLPVKKKKKKTTSFVTYSKKSNWKKIRRKKRVGKKYVPVTSKLEGR